MLYMIMECDDRALLDAWMAQWSDLIDFEVETVMTSADAVAAITPSLPCHAKLAGYRRVTRQSASTQNG